MMASPLKTELQAALLAFGLLTRLPMPRTVEMNTAVLGRSLHWYPLVGLVIGLALAAVSALSLPTPLLGALVVATWVALTGALHLDGLADCADAWVGDMGDRERTLKILKDPACGPMGVTALVLTLLLKTAAVAVLLDQSSVFLLLLAPAIARVLLPLAFVVTPYVRTGGMGESLAQQHSRPGVAIALVAVLSVGLIVLPQPLFFAWLVAAGVLLAAWRRAMMQRLGGFTGDGAGALVELGETLLLLVAAVFAGGAA